MITPGGCVLVLGWCSSVVGILDTLRRPSVSGVARETIVVSVIGRVAIEDSGTAHGHCLMIRGVDGIDVVEVLILRLSLPELPLAAARGVVVCWRWAVLLLSLVVTGDPHLNQGTEQEEETGLLSAGIPQL